MPRNPKTVDVLAATQRRRLATIGKQLAAVYARIAKERDKIDDLISEAEAIRENCDSALTSMVEARDALSQYL
jgi:uncharacterized protein YdcH (DUF465 family)